MVTSEAHPFAKTGGLGDVMGALPAALRDLGLEVTVCLPAFRSALARASALDHVATVFAPVSSRTEAVEVLRVRDTNPAMLLFRADRYFDRDFLYGPPGGAYLDNAERFVVFCRAVLEWAQQVGPAPDVLHVHDWQAALAVALLRTAPQAYPALRHTRTVATIHNLAYQGRFWAADWHLLNVDPAHFTPEGFEFWGDINFLKAGLVHADAITTVSPRYAQEIQTPELGEGLDGVLRARAERVTGILNGIDVAMWDPRHDPHLAAPFGVDHLAGKSECKAALQARCGLAPRTDIPLVGMVTRLARQKGIDVVLEPLGTLLAEDAIQLVILADGDPEIEWHVRHLCAQHPARAAFHRGFDEALAHQIEAGADLFLMPSRFEPCGLNQLYSLRYGTIPVVHAVGGLDDSVEEWDPERRAGTGFKFLPLTPVAAGDALRRAIAAWTNPTTRETLRRNGMRFDHSWGRSALAYAALYRHLTLG